MSLHISQLLPNLAELSLQAYHVTDTALAYFTARQGHSTHTLRLLSCWEITNHGVVNVVHSLPNLTALSLSGCSKVTDDGVELVAENLRKLRSLDLSWCPRITDMALEYVACDLHRLEELVLDRCAAGCGRGTGRKEPRGTQPRKRGRPELRGGPRRCQVGRARVLHPQVRSHHRHRPQLPVHHVVSPQSLPAMVLPGTGDPGAGGEAGAPLHPAASSDRRLSGLPRHALACPERGWETSLRTPRPRPGASGNHERPCSSVQVQDFGLKHLLAMRSLRLLSLAGEPGFCARARGPPWAQTRALSRRPRSPQAARCSPLRGSPAWRSCRSWRSWS